MPIEKDEMRRIAPIDLLVDAIEKLHRRLRPTLAERIEWLHRDANDWRLGRTTTHDRQGSPPRRLACRSRVLPLRAGGLHPGSPFPRILLPR
jgi:hypothetical protein